MAMPWTMHPALVSALSLPEIFVINVFPSSNTGMPILMFGTGSFSATHTNYLSEKAKRLAEMQESGRDRGICGWRGAESQVVQRVEKGLGNGNCGGVQDRLKGNAKGGFVLGFWRVAVVLVVTMGARRNVRVMMFR